VAETNPHLAEDVGRTGGRGLPFGGNARNGYPPDRHCVTKWSKFDTEWQGVSLDVLLEDVETPAEADDDNAAGAGTTGIRTLRQAPRVERIAGLVGVALG
jgi:hypothetical protein